MTNTMAQETFARNGQGINTLGIERLPAKTTLLSNVRRGKPVISANGY